MIDDATDKRIPALAQLTTLKEWLDKGTSPGQSVVDDYNRALDQLDGIGENVDQFRLPPNSLKTDPRRSAGVPTVSKSLMFSRLNTLLTYFAIREEILAQAADRKENPATLIGFNRPDKQ